MIVYGISYIYIYLCGWWFGTFGLLFHILGIIIPTDYYFSEGYVYHQPEMMLAADS